MVKGYHVIFCTYGFWLPNDPRGSWSDFVGAWALLRFGPATKTTTRRSIACIPHNHTLRRQAKAELKYPEVHLTGLQARTIARGFARYITKSQIPVWACSILPQHVHAVIGRHRLTIESITNQLKGYATRELMQEGVHPMKHFSDRPSCWSRGQWSVYLNTQSDIERAIGYVERNPEKEGLRRQNWNFVQRYCPTV